MVYLDKVPQVENPCDRAGFLSSVTFWWLRNFLCKGYKNGGSHKLEDVPRVRDGFEAGALGGRLEENWSQEMEMKEGDRKPRLARAIVKMVWSECRLLAIWPLLSECVLKVLLAFIMSWMIHSFKVKDGGAWLLGMNFVAVSGLSVVAHHTLLYQSYMLGIKVKAALSSLIYRKVLRLSIKSLDRTNIGHVTTLLTNDVTQCDEIFLFLHYTWIGVLQFLMITIISWKHTGVGSLGGTAFILILMGFQTFISSKFASLRKETAKMTDERLKAMNETIVNMKMIKLHAWEFSFGDLIQERRRKEMKVIRRKSVLEALNNVCLMVGTKGIQLAFLVTYVLLMSPCQTLSSETIYLSLGLLSGARVTMTWFLPYSITSLTQWLASVKRVQTFMELREVHKDVETDCSTGLTLKGLSVAWNSDKINKHSLERITLRVVPGVLTVITGAVGTGKTTLLHTILGEIPLAEGNLNVGGSIGYASQEAWIIPGSVRDNILFGKDMNKTFYWEVVRMCSLDKDLASWKFGDNTVVGERGLMLSGGQKARISLARAVYQDADTYLLDDVFAAVDATVGQHIMEKCVQGHLSSKTVLITTHSQHCAAVAHELYELHARTLCKRTDRQDFKNDLTLAEKHWTFDLDIQSPCQSFEGGELTVKGETKQDGTVSWSTYYLFFASSRSYAIIFVYVALCLVSPIAHSVSDIFVAKWLNFVRDDKKTHSELPDNMVYLLVFTCLIFLLVLIMASKVLCQYKVCMDSAQALHNDMFQKLLRAPMSFFTSNPVGQIMTRFSKDLFALDEMLPYTVFEVETLFFRITTTLLVIGYYMPLIFLPVALLVFVSLWIQKLYVMSSNPLKRLEGISKAPLLSQVNSTVAGIITIRTSGKEHLIKEEFDLQQDVLTSIVCTYQAVDRWFCVWIEILAVTFQAVVVGTLVLSDDVFQPGDVGVVLLMLSDLTRTMQKSLKMTAYLQNVMISSERILEYGRLPPEGSLVDTLKLDNWPNKGDIRYRNVSLTYGEKVDLVLKNLNFEITRNEKIGIVGRTGAGKSSLLSALFRLSEPCGEIYIDGILTSAIGLHKLRKNISIIPQDPLLISGSLRRNLDPFEEFDDEVLWKALDKAHMGSLVKISEQGLQMQVLEGGGNLSSGQKQLLCLARAIVRSNRILILDEATANVDPRTDKLIMKTIRNHFHDCTVLIVAHRLHTVMHCNRIMVMSEGQILEFDSPCILLEDDNSALSGFLQGMPQEEQRQLREQAEKARTYRSRIA